MILSSATVVPYPTLPAGNPIMLNTAEIRAAWNGMTRILLAIALASAARAQCPVQDALAPAAIKNYPLISDRYAVQYSVNGGSFTLAKVYISYYGGSLASPPRADAPYTPLQESMSFVSIPAAANTAVQIRIT